MDEQVKRDVPAPQQEKPIAPPKKPMGVIPMLLTLVFIVAIVAFVVWVVISIIRKIIMWFWIIVAALLALIVAPFVLPFLILW